MQYPIWEVPMLGGGMVIAIIAIIHVTIAHFAVGAGLFAAVTETKAIWYNQPLLLRFLRDFIRYLILVSFVLGALTGVGIWFSISLVSPEATSTLIHQFVWGWATEWVFFFLEITAGYIYYYTWDRLEPRKHVIIGWIYAVSAYMSLVIINGILTFMLTPGAWLETFSFWDGFFNPTYWPSLVLRTISCTSLAAIFVMVAVNFARGYTREERHQVIMEGGKWMVPLALMLPASIWFFIQVPQEARLLVSGQAIAMTLFFLFGVAASTLVGLYAYFGLILRQRYINLETSILLGMIAFIATGSMEFVREGIRKPFIIYEYMYSNAIRTADSGLLNQEGVLAWAPWTVLAVGGTSEAELTPEQRGEALFRAQCLRCHTLDGFNGIKPLIKRWPENSIRHALENLHVEQYYMPPFFGPEKDLEELTRYLLSLNQGEAAPQSNGKITANG
ncbi:MAG TPA: cytochrome ubiquinol oxidase subunit I [bacterium]|nr:cytochrome ubiquinol oxidase subunit I [bacterium]HOL95397.1 cytochrome ubiquinol oxidase subunit I [bacterium]HPO99596.1 cytochrome ubiquinol oxidase subunit I [bacterium]